MIEVNIHTLPHHISNAFIGVDTTIGLGKVAARYHAFLHPETYRVDSEALGAALKATRHYIEVNGNHFNPADAFPAICKLALMDRVLINDLTKAAVLSRYAFAQTAHRPLKPREWFKALGKLGYKVYLCN